MTDSYSVLICESSDGLVARLTVTQDKIVVQSDYPADAADRFNRDCKEWLTSTDLEELENVQREFDAGDLVEVKRGTA